MAANQQQKRVGDMSNPVSTFFDFFSRLSHHEKKLIIRQIYGNLAVSIDLGSHDRFNWRYSTEFARANSLSDRVYIGPDPDVIAPLIRCGPYPGRGDDERDKKKKSLGALHYPDFQVVNTRLASIFNNSEYSEKCDLLLLFYGNRLDYERNVIKPCVSLFGHSKFSVTVPR